MRWQSSARALAVVAINVAGSFRDAMGLNKLSAGLSGYCNYSRGMLWVRAKTGRCAIREA